MKKIKMPLRLRRDDGLHYLGGTKAANNETLMVLTFQMFDGKSGGNNEFDEIDEIDEFVTSSKIEVWILPN